LGAVYNKIGSNFIAPTPCSSTIFKPHSIIYVNMPIKEEFEKARAELQAERSREEAEKEAEKAKRKRIYQERLAVLDKEAERLLRPFLPPLSLAEGIFEELCDELELPHRREDGKDPRVKEPEIIWMADFRDNSDNSLFPGENFEINKSGRNVISGINENIYSSEKLSLENIERFIESGITIRWASVVLKWGGGWSGGGEWEGDSGLSSGSYSTNSLSVLFRRKKEGGWQLAIGRKTLDIEDSNVIDKIRPTVIEEFVRKA